MIWYDLLASDMELEYEDWEKTEMEWEVRIPFNTEGEKLRKTAQ